MDVRVQHYRKKPVVIKAVQWPGGAEAAARIVQWVRDNGGSISYFEEERYYRPDDGRIITEHLRIGTLEGTMMVSVNDWVIQGVQGEFYPCKPDIFEATYEMAW